MKLLSKEDIRELFRYIAELFSNCPPDKWPKETDAEVEAWVEGLAGYSKAQVGWAVRKCKQKSRYCPSLAEIVAQLPPIPEGERTRYAPPDPIELAHMEQSRAWQRERHAELHARGLPTLSEAMEAGMSVAQWNTALKEAGVWEP